MFEEESESIENEKAKLKRLRIEDENYLRKVNDADN